MITPGSVQRGFAHAAEGVANTADMLGATNVGKYLHNQVNQGTLNAPTSAEAVTDAFRQGHYGSALLNLPGAVGEAVPQLAASVAGAAGGAAAGTALGGPVGGVGGLAAGAGATAITGIALQAGDIAKARAKADGRDEPNDQDIAIAVGSSAILGSLDRIGLGKAAGSVLTSAVKRTLGRDAAGTAGSALGAMAVHGASDAVQSVAQQAAETAGTSQGLTVDPSAVASQAAIGAGARGALGVARNVQDRATGQAARDAQAAQLASDRSSWAAMSPEERDAITTTAGAGQAIRAVQDAATGDVSPNVAARTAIAQRRSAVLDFANHAASDDVGTLSTDQVMDVRRAVRAASSPHLTLTADHIDAMDALPLSDAQRTAIKGSLAVMNTLSNPASMAAVGGPVSQAFGVAGDLASHAMHVKGVAGFAIRPIVNSVMSKIGGTLDKLIGADKPRIRPDAERAAAMLDANGLAIPDNMGDLRSAIAQSKTAVQAMADALGLDPSNYGPDAAGRTAMNRKVAADMVAAPGGTTTMTPAEALALAKSGMASGTPVDSLQTPNAAAGSGVAANGSGASTGLPESVGRMSDQAPEMLGSQSVPAQLMAAKLPRWMWVMGQHIQKDLALSGMARNVNYAKEAAATIGALRDAGMIDGPMHDALMSYQGQRMPTGFYNLVRQQWLLNHGIDRRSLDAQTAGVRAVH